MNTQILLDKISQARQKRFLNNYYSMDSADRSTGIWEKDDEFIFSWEDHGVQRLSFFIREWQSLNILLGQMNCGEYYLEFMTKDPGEFIPKEAERVAAMMRLANPDCRNVFQPDSPVLVYKDTSIGQLADEFEAGEINQLLWATFHTEISHLLTDQELKAKINQFTIHRTENLIDAVLQAEILPKKFYINQIVNKGEKKNIHAMLLNRLETYINSGGKYLYAWVEDKNIASQKFHAKYGMKHDGMWNMVYCMEK